jgi:hypothetical protein
MSQIGTITRSGGGGGEVFTLTGTTGGGPVAPDGLGNITLQAGAGLTITGEPLFNRLVFVNTEASSSLTWVVDAGAGPINLVAGIGHFANNAGTISYNLPAVASVGDIFAIAAMNNNNSWEILQAAGQSIKYGNLTTTAGVAGGISSSRTGDIVTFVCNVADTGFFVISSIGNLTVV